MREKIIKNRKYILLTIAFLLALAFNLGMRYLATRPRYKTLPEVRLVNQKEESTKGLAIMIPNDIGDGYVEYEGDKWPSGYKYVKAECIDNKGKSLENTITFKDGKLEFETDRTVSCTIYFDNKPLSIIDKLREKDTQAYLSEDLQGGMYRYQAAPASVSDAANMTNWICFGTNKEECTSTTGIDRYMYRIIGITEDGQMYLIKETFLKEGSTTGFAWNTATYISSGSGVNYCSGGVCPEWNEADLFQRINGTSNGTTSGNGVSTHADTDIFVDSTQYDYLKSGDGINGTDTPSEWYNLIEDHEWMYGDTIETSNVYNGNTMYAIETGNKETTHYVGKYGSVKSETYTWPSTNKVKAKISLMYLHDIDYAYPGGNPNSDSNVKNSWIHFQKDGYNSSPTYERFSTRWGISSSSENRVRVRYVDGSGILKNGDGPLAFSVGVRPVFYLSSKAKIVDGNGTKSDPYILG